MIPNQHHVDENQTMTDPLRLKTRPFSHIARLLFSFVWEQKKDLVILP